jgi:hypothetical protein
MAGLYGVETTIQVRDEVRILVDNMTERRFSSGSTGFYAQGRITVDGRTFMVNLQAVEAGSKSR